VIFIFKAIAFRRDNRGAFLFSNIRKNYASLWIWQDHKGPEVGLVALNKSEVIADSCEKNNQARFFG
jgi:hypothetical protein